MTKARSDQPDTSAELSEAARAAVRDAGDPRIDAHLAALGLGDDDAPSPPRRRQARSADATEIAALRAQVAELEASLAAAGRRIRWLAVALVVALTGLAGLILLLVGRPG